MRREPRAGDLHERSTVALGLLAGIGEPREGSAQMVKVLPPSGRGRRGRRFRQFSKPGDGMATDPAGYTVKTPTSAATGRPHIAVLIQ